MLKPDGQNLAQLSGSLESGDGSDAAIDDASTTDYSETTETAEEGEKKEETTSFA